MLEEIGQKYVWCLGLYSCTKPLINKLKTEATDLHSVITKIFNETNHKEDLRYGKQYNMPY